jgi:hypothetical protein
MATPLLLPSISGLGYCHRYLAWAYTASHHPRVSELRASQQCEKELAAKATQFTQDFLADSQV